MYKIVITGPESSGKTTLCKALSSHFNLPFAKEYAREYLDLLNRDYNQSDLLKIAKGQLQAENEMQLLDTDLVTLKIWSKYKYNSCDKWILDKTEKQKSKNRFYLLCKPDIAWKPDPLRENPKNRMNIFKIYKDELDNLEHNYLIVEGENRIKKSISKISPLIATF